MEESLAVKEIQQKYNKYKGDDCGDLVAVGARITKKTMIKSDNYANNNSNTNNDDYN